MTDSSQLNFSRALQEAVTVPGVVMQAYSAFHEYSIGNQLLALIQCGMRGLQPGPLRTYKGWQQHGRQVQRGQRALILCMPITYKRNTSTDLAPGEIEPDEVYSTSFMYRARWFVLSQTEGEEFELPALPHWNAELALENLQITRISFTDTDGNCQGYARDRQIAINPVAQLPQKTLLHETAHVVLGHTLEHTITDGERTPKNLREVEAEAVALLCGEALGLDGSEYCRGYIQGWLRNETIPEASAKKIFGAAERILKAGRPNFENRPSYIN
jgi:hypothetical protein